MIALKHSPAPWVEDKAANAIVDRDGKFVCDLKAVTEGNKRLLVASPAMLATLKVVRAALEGADAPDHHTYGLLEVYEAICKAVTGAEDDAVDGG